jgi:hypothetical protein
LSIISIPSASIELSQYAQLPPSSSITILHHDHMGLPHPPTGQHHDSIKGRE